MTLSADPELEEEEIRAIDFLRYMDAEVKELRKKSLLATFNYDTNMTKINRKAMYTAITEGMKRTKELWNETKSFNWRTYKDADVKRQFWLRSNLGIEALPESQYKKLMKLTYEMRDILNNTKIPSFEDPVKAEITLDPDIKHVLATSSNQNELQHTYNEYVRLVGEKTKPLYKESVEIINDSAKLNGFADAGDEWLSTYEDSKFKLTAQNLYKDIKMLYALLHSYVRYKLRVKYGEVVSKNGPIPIHLTGGLHGDSFEHLYQLVKPFPEVADVDYDQEIIKQNYDTEKVLKLAEDFYVSLNMSELPELFWNHSVFQKPKDGEMSCVEKAYDIEPDDPRIKTCVRITREGLRQAHRDIGRIEYFLQFGDLPQVYRNWANEAFGEAVGNSIALSFMSLRHAKSINLTSSELSEEAHMNNAFYMLLQTLPFMTFAYAVDTWRWDVFNGNITEADYNCKWRKIVEDIQGLEAPTDRSSNGFDISTDYNLVSNVPYIRYFAGKILEYQFYRAMCLKSNEYVPHVFGKELYKCDFYGSVTAGNDLKAMLRLGSSKPWVEALHVLTGQNYLDSSAIMEYYKPVQMWLEDEIEKLNIPIGWIKSTKVCHQTKQEKSME